MGFVHTSSSPVCVADLKALEMKADIQARRAQNQLGVIVWQVSAAAASSAAIPAILFSRVYAFGFCLGAFCALIFRTAE